MVALSQQVTAVPKEGLMLLLLVMLLLLLPCKQFQGSVHQARVTV